MATRTEVVTFDDFNGTPGAERIPFGYCGVDYEIDLDKRNAEEFFRVLEPYLEKGRRLTAARRARTPRQRAGSGPDPVAVRQWARDNGIHVPQRGRLPQNTIDRYMTEHQPAF